MMINGRHVPFVGLFLGCVRSLMIHYHLSSFSVEDSDGNKSVRGVNMCVKHTVRSYHCVQNQ